MVICVVIINVLAVYSSLTIGGQVSDWTWLYELIWTFTVAKQLNWRLWIVVYKLFGVLSISLIGGL